MSFIDQVAQFAQKARDSINETQRAIVLELFSSVIMDTPVDTGRSRGEWLTSSGTPVTTLANRLDMSGLEAVTDIVAAIPKSGDITMYLTNNLPYIGALEYGHSNQAPSGMVRKNIARLEKIIASAITVNKV